MLSGEGSDAKGPAAADGNGHPTHPPSDSEWENYWTAYYAVSLGRRGTLLASGHTSALVPI